MGSDPVPNRESDIEACDSPLLDIHTDLSRFSPTVLRDKHSFRFDSDVLPVETDHLRRFSRSSSFTSYSSLHEDDAVRNLRFQVIIWYVGPPDEVLGKVDMRFRVSIFWNAPEGSDSDEKIGYGMNNPRHKKVWTMYGRQRAYQRELNEITGDSGLVYVPPISILNAIDFETLGEPEVCLINAEDNLMKWSCLYKASLLQDRMNVASFPHDSHDLVLRLGVLKHRGPRKRWDKTRWKLDLATRDDTHDTISIPHGTIVDHVKVPGFSFGSEGLQFEFRPLEFGSTASGSVLIGAERDQCLEVKIKVTRQSSYYDRNITPLLAALNFVAICSLALEPSEFGSRGQIILAISFVEIGIRMTVDSRLPAVGYQIKIQFILNNFFFGLLFLAVTSSVAYLFQDYGYNEDAQRVDQLAGILEFLHMVVILAIYYTGNGGWCDSLCGCRLLNQLAIDFLHGSS